MKIAFLTTCDPRDKLSWSGTIYHMSKALERHCDDVTNLGPVEPPLRNVLRVYGRLRGRLGGRRYLHDRTVRLARACSRDVLRKLGTEHYDAIVATTSAIATAYLDTDIPIVYISDTTFALMEDYYPGFSDLTEASHREGNEIEARAILGASVLVYPSQWAARSAVDDYGADEDRVRIVALGANLDFVPDADRVLRQREGRGSDCTLLFIGVSWERKGGEIALEAAIRMNEAGVATKLIVCGCTPPDSAAHPCMQVEGFLDKRDERQSAELARLYDSADFFLLPTRSECYGIVFCEASAYGLPVITTDTGGVSGVVFDGKNGYALPPEARGDDYARVILELFRDRPRYAELRRTSRREFDETLNWDSWGTRIRSIIEGLTPAWRQS
ncbi:MAG: glycosyltransferase family 4 protein [Candidatus Eisenbacteria sp.]|nr:glycosyltransferase family 4 protein [Candidatus Eisenbacteria bacterium]